MFLPKENRAQERFLCTPVGWEILSLKISLKSMDMILLWGTIWRFLGNVLHYWDFIRWSWLETWRGAWRELDLWSLVWVSGSRGFSLTSSWRMLLMIVMVGTCWHFDSLFWFVFLFFLLEHKIIFLRNFHGWHGELYIFLLHKTLINTVKHNSVF